MPKQVVLPQQLLNAKSLSKSAKLLWALRRLGLGQRRSGLCRDTYRTAMSQLRSGGWLSRVRGRAWASIPSDLLLDGQVGTQARLLYAQLQFTPGFRRNSGQFTFTLLCQRTGVSRNALKEAVKRLVTAGWLVINPTTKFAPIGFTLNRSAFRSKENEVASAVWEYSNADSDDEGLMQALLSAVVASRDYACNVRPGFLTNPETGHELEFDRYYPPQTGPDGEPVGAVAFEYQGIQHYRTTKQFPDEGDLRKRQRHDRCKAGICAQRSIRLVLVHDEDLSLDRMRQKVEGLLPLRNLDECRHLVKVVKDLCIDYRNRLRLPLPLPTPRRKNA